MPFCTKCGSELEDGDRFCSNCGAPVGSSPVQAQADTSSAISNANNVTELFFNMEAGSFVNYHMSFRDNQGNLVFDAKTVSESFTGYTMRAWDPNGNEAFTVKTTKGGFNTLRFVLLNASKQPVCDIVQKAVKNAYAYDLPELNIFAQGDFINCNFRVEQNGVLIAETARNHTFAKDSYTIRIYDNNQMIPVLGIAFAIQLDAIVRRRRRR